jgi:hypothetical protein
MKKQIVIMVFVLTFLLSACGSQNSSKQVETQVAATIAAGQTATVANNNQVETQVAATIAAGQTATAVYVESVNKTLTAIAPSATNTLSPSPEAQNTEMSTQTPSAGTIPESQNADAIAGSWSGTEGYAGKDQTQVKISIQSNCTIGSVCGSISLPQFGCAGNIVLTKVKNDTTFVMRENITSGGDGCTSQTGGSDTLILNSDGSLSLKYYFKDGKAGATGILNK